MVAHGSSGHLIFTHQMSWINKRYHYGLLWSLPCVTGQRALGSRVFFGVSYRAWETLKSLSLDSLWLFNSSLWKIPSASNHNSVNQIYSCPSIRTYLCFAELVPDFVEDLPVTIAKFGDPNPKLPGCKSHRCGKWLLVLNITIDINGFSSAMFKFKGFQKWQIWNQRFEVQVLSPNPKNNHGLNSWMAEWLMLGAI
jgi:hypothetical protein